MDSIARFPGRNLGQNGFQQTNGINPDDLRDLIDSQLDYDPESIGLVGNNNLGDLSGMSPADVDYIKQQHQEALAQGLLPQPGSGGRGRSRANKSGPPPVEPLTAEQLNNLQQGSGSLELILLAMQSKYSRVILDEFHFRWLENSGIEIGNAA